MDSSEHNVVDDQLHLGIPRRILAGSHDSPLIHIGLGSLSGLILGSVLGLLQGRILARLHSRLLVSTHAAMDHTDQRSDTCRSIP